MAKVNDTTFTIWMNKIKVDTLHPAYLNDILSNNQIKDLVEYVRSYKEQNVIP